MAHRILSISHFQGAFHYVEIDKQAGGYFPQTPAVAPTLEALAGACRKADEIHINAEWPGAAYVWSTFPKVAKRYQNNLVAQDAKERIGGTSPVHVQFRSLGEVTEGGNVRSKLTYVGLPEEEIAPIWNAFDKYMGKVKHIGPLTLALTSAVAQTAKPENDFMVVWVGDESTVLAIGSSEGLVKLSRTLPIGMSAAESLPEEIGREVFMTSNYYKQEFRTGVPNTIYFLGGAELERIFTENPMPGSPENVVFGLPDLPVKGMDSGQVYRIFHLVANLYMPKDFSFLPEDLVSGRQTGMAFKLAVAVLVLAILGSCYWAFGLFMEKQTRLNEIQRQQQELTKLQNQVAQLRNDVNRLKPFAGWKQFYEETFEKRPAWPMLLSELSILLPENILIEDFSYGGKGGRSSRGATGDTAVVSGVIKAENWQAGLNDLRAFGEKLQSSPYFEVVDVKYSPEKLDDRAKVFDFAINVNLSSAGVAHGS